MNVTIVELPGALQQADSARRAVVVFDVLRATTTMSAALDAGVKRILVYDSLDAARVARANEPQALLAGEVRCVKPVDFDLGNSPGDLQPARHAGRTMLLATTNGTRAIHRVKTASHVLIGALVNAQAVAMRLRDLGRDVTLLCAGTDGQVAPEDLLGCAAVVAELQAMAPVTLEGKFCRQAMQLLDQFQANRIDTLRQTQGGKNIIAAGLEADIEFASRLNAIQCVGGVLQDPLRVERLP